MTLRPAQPLDLPRNWAQPMIEARRLLSEAGALGEDGAYDSAIWKLEELRTVVASAKKAMEQAREGK